MNLEELLYGCLVEFTNNDNNIIQEAENKFHEIISQNPCNEIVKSLINIIGQNPSSIVSFSALVQAKTLIFKYLFSKCLEPQLIINLRETFCKFYIDMRFPSDRRKSFLLIISYFYIYSKNPINELPFPDLFPFLKNALQNDELYPEILELYCTIVKPDDPNFNFYDQERNQFLLEHLDPSSSQIARSKTLIFFLNFWPIYGSSFSQNFDILKILDSLDGDYFRESYICFSYCYLSDINLGIDPQNLFDLLLSRIVNIHNFELNRVFCLYSLRCLIDQKQSIFNCLLSNLENFYKMLIISSSEPYLYPGLYTEAKDSLTSIYNTVENLMPLIKFMYQIPDTINDYSLSLFTIFMADPNHLQRGIFYATNEDPFLRSNGLKYAKRLVKVRNRFINSRPEIFDCIAEPLIKSYYAFRDPMTLTTLAKIFRAVSPNILAKFAQPIMNICTTFPSLEAVDCGSSILALNDTLGMDDEFSLFLLNNIIEILKSDQCYSLTYLSSFLPKITLHLSMEKRIEFLNFFMPLALQDPEVLISNGMDSLLVQLGENINIYEEPILTQLFNLFNILKENNDFMKIGIFLESLTSYGLQFQSFEEKYLEMTIEFCQAIISSREIIDCDIEASDFIRKSLKKFPENENLFKSVSDFIFKAIYENDDDICRFSCLIKIVNKLLKSHFVDNERKMLFLNNLKPLIDFFSQMLISNAESDKVADRLQSKFYDEIHLSFANIFSNLNESLLEASLQYISMNLMNLENYSYKIQKIIIDIYYIILKSSQDWSGEIFQLIFHKYFQILSSIQISQADLYELFNKMPSDDEWNDFLTLHISIINNLSHLLQHNHNLPLANQLFSIVFNILANQKLDNYSYSSFIAQCFGCLVLISMQFRLSFDPNNQQSVNEVAELVSFIFKFMPNCLYFDNLSFYYILQILLFSISSGIFPNEMILAMLAVTSQAISEQKINDTSALRTFYQQYKDSDKKDILEPVFAEIRKLL